MQINEYASMLNAILSFSIVFILSFYRRGHAIYRPWVSRLAWVIVIIYGGVGIRYLVGLYHHTHWSIVLVNLIICIAVFRVRGNLARLIDLRL